MYRFYCDAFQLHLAGQHLALDPRNYPQCTEEEAAAVALAASDVRDNRRAPRTRAEVEAEVRRLLAPAAPTQAEILTVKFGDAGKLGAQS